jgi:hypothetical protein
MFNEVVTESFTGNSTPFDDVTVKVRFAMDALVGWITMVSDELPPSAMVAIVHCTTWPVAVQALLEPDASENPAGSVVESTTVVAVRGPVLPITQW